jgi:hypothetical protein
VEPVANELPIEDLMADLLDLFEVVEIEPVQVLSQRGIRSIKRGRLCTINIYPSGKQQWLMNEVS